MTVMIVPEVPTGTLNVTAEGLDELRRAREKAEYSANVQLYEGCRLYYGGEQYDRENDEASETLGYDAASRRLPEHLRKHAYSSHIQEAIDVLADMLAEGIQFNGAHADLLNSWWSESEMEDRCDDWFREALICGDAYAQPRYDPFLDLMDVDFWEAEAAWPVYAEDDWKALDHWYRFRTYFSDEDQIEHTEERIAVMLPHTEVAPTRANPSGVVFQVWDLVYVDDVYDHAEEQRLPWFDLVHGRGDTRHRVRSRFGDSMITRKVRGTADRYNAIAQLGFRVARQNAFATLAVVGDAAFLGQARRDEAVPKDIADVLSFPGGTDVKAIVLPTDPRTMEFQTKLLEKNLYREFGLTKTDMDDMSGMGTVSGYALEVLNRKDRATHKRIRKNAVSAIIDLANSMLDVHAIRSGEMNGTPWWMVDPLETYPDRAGIKVVIGSGDIVDAVGDRDDYTAGIVSRKYVLRRKGHSDTEITTIEEEVYAEQQHVADITNESVLAQQDAQAQTDMELARITAAARQTTTGTTTQTGTTQQGG